MTEAHIANTTAFLRQFPDQLRGISGGMLTTIMDVHVASKVLRNLSVRESYPDTQYWVAPEDVQDIVREAAAGKAYDAVVTAYRMDDSRDEYFPPILLATRAIGVATYGVDFGWTWRAGYAQIVLPWGGDMWHRDNNLLLHEWGHVMEMFYGGQPGVEVALMHDYWMYGYGVDEWMRTWNLDFYQGRVWNATMGRFVGLNATVYGYGTPSNPAKPPQWDPQSVTLPSPPRRPPRSPPSPPRPASPPFPPAPPGDVPVATATLGSFRYEAFSEMRSWDDAEAFCRSARGGHLASQTSVAEAVVVRQMAQQAADSSMTPYEKSVWLGLRCYPPNKQDGTRGVCTSKEQYTTWSDGLTAAGYTEWTRDEVSNARWQTVGYDCVAMQDYLWYRWEDTFCNWQQPFVCKVPF
ncbi:hypothetical protein GPECTOR_8g44 [Gonium pectorale]|uniref:C-type lectin domain-containing protein n=1 Tax=Gonium pectorale TaxID=33097 RepID=A0A150GT69_GONPE|nr:hypothetical protein GPECTOR_8g44 [Gonium pectorale]|eukprot:KXZ53049.1 hypothetical protein GPECTOR_8g44 [Gonium pectorale]